MTSRNKIIEDILPFFLSSMREKAKGNEYIIDGRSQIHECKAREIIGEVYDLLLIHAGSQMLRVMK